MGALYIDEASAKLPRQLNRDLLWSQSGDTQIWSLKFNECFGARAAMLGTFSQA